MKLKEAFSILENMCIRYGPAEQKNRTKEQIKEVKALNTILHSYKKGRGDK